MSHLSATRRGVLGPDWLTKGPRPIYSGRNKTRRGNYLAQFQFILVETRHTEEPRIYSKPNNGPKAYSWKVISQPKSIQLDSGSSQNDSAGFVVLSKNKTVFAPCKLYSAGGLSPKFLNYQIQAGQGRGCATCSAAQN